MRLDESNGLTIGAQIELKTTANINHRIIIISIPEIWQPLTSRVRQTNHERPSGHCSNRRLAPHTALEFVTPGSLRNPIWTALSTTLNANVYQMLGHVVFQLRDKTWPSTESQSRAYWSDDDQSQPSVSGLYLAFWRFDLLKIVRR